MALIASLLTGGDNNHESTVEQFNAIATDFLSEGVVGAITNTSGVAPSTGAFAVNAQGTPDMTVAVTSGIAYVTGTPTGGTSQTLRINLNANENVTISANSSGSTKYDWIYISIDADNAADPNAGGDDVASLVTSRSSSASSDDGTPPTYGYSIAVVTVSNGASSITNGNIADSRTNALQIVERDVADDAVTPAKWTNPYCFRVYATSSTNLSAGGYTQVEFQAEDYDYNNDFASNAYTAPVTGVYNFTAGVRSASGNERFFLAFYNDDTIDSKSTDVYDPSAANVVAGGATHAADFLVQAGDTVKLYCYTDDGGDNSTGRTDTWFAGHLVHAT